MQQLDEHGLDAKVLAGGQSLIPTMNFRMAQPGVLVDINRISDLSYIVHDDKGTVLIGAMTRQSVAERHEIIRNQAPLIYETLPLVAHPQIRNRGTLGGSIAHADPAAEMPAVTMALNARYAIRNKSGERWVDAKDFFVGLFATVLEPEDLLTEIAIPQLPSRSGYAFSEVSRRHGDYAMCGVATVLTLDDSDKCKEARMVFLSVGDTPQEATQAADALKGEEVSKRRILEAASVAAEKDIDPSADIHASKAFRRQLAKVVVRDTLQKALARAKES